MGQEQAQASEDKPNSSTEAISPEGAIIYADAGVRPVNPGFGGWGFHGYTYTKTEPKKSMGPNGLALTPTGYAPKSSKLAEVTPIHYLDAFGTIPHVSNNGAEVLAAAHALSTAARWGLKELTIKTDSKYVITGAQEYLPRWKVNNWCKADGMPVSNLEHWQFLDKHLSALRGSGVSITFEWVKGHNGDQGNEMADKYATIGALASGAGQDKVLTQIAEAASYWKDEEEGHPLLAHRSMYFVTNPDNYVKGEYYLGNHGKDDELLGKRMADGSYSYVELEQPDPYVHHLISKQIKVCNGEDQIVLARLDELFKPKTRKDLMVWGEDLLCLNLKKSQQRRKDLYLVGGSDEEPVTSVLNPPLLAMRAVESVNFLKDLFLHWKEGRLGAAGVLATDITALFYEDEIKKSNKKGEEPKIVGKKIRSDFTSAIGSIKALTTLASQTPGEGLQLDFELIVNIDIPNRNVFKKIEKLDPKVTLLVWKDGNKAYRYATVIECKGGKSIWCGYYSNYKYIFDDNKKPATKPAAAVK